MKYYTSFFILCTIVVALSAPLHGFNELEIQKGANLEQSLLHTLGLIHKQGFAPAHPTIFGVTTNAKASDNDKSRLTQAMDIARGGAFSITDLVVKKSDVSDAAYLKLISEAILMQFMTNTAHPTSNLGVLSQYIVTENAIINPPDNDPNNDKGFKKVLERAWQNHYPRKAWYFKSDPTCFYDCQTFQYFKFGSLSFLDAHTRFKEKDQGGLLANDWELHTPELVEAVDPTLYTLLTSPSPDIKMPTFLPNGNYTPLFKFPNILLNSPAGTVTTFTPTENILVTPDLKFKAFMQSSYKEGSSIPLSKEEGFVSYNRMMEVFGTHVLAHEDISTANILHVADVIAQWLDNNGDGIPDNIPVAYQLAIATATIRITPDSGPSYSASHISVASPLVINGPNPFNPNKGTTSFQYMLSENSKVDMEIYNLAGDTIYETSIPYGHQGGNKGFNYTLTWDGRNKYNAIVANGVYIAYFKFTGSRITFSKCKIVVYK